MSRHGSIIGQADRSLMEISPMSSDSDTPDTQACECCEKTFDLKAMSSTEDGCWLCEACSDELVEMGSST